jgi:hypothetical protein
VARTLVECPRDTGLGSAGVTASVQIYPPTSCYAVATRRMRSSCNIAVSENLRHHTENAMNGFSLGFLVFAMSGPNRL